MEIELLTVGKTTIPWVITGIDHYLKKLKHYIPFSINVVPDIKKGKNLTESLQKIAEGEQILNRIAASDVVILLDEHGREYRSTEFASYLEKLLAGGYRKVIFVVGGPYGFSQAVYDRANAKVSLSKMTFNHEMVRLFFVEQVYRGLSILRGEPYHHE